MSPTGRVVKRKKPFTFFHGSVLTSWRAAFKNFASAGLNGVCLMADMAGNMGISSSPQTRAGQTSCDQCATSSQQGPFCVRINSPTGGTTWELQCQKAGGYKLGVRLDKLSLRFPEGCICPSWRAELQGLSGYGQRGRAIDLEEEFCLVAVMICFSFRAVDAGLPEKSWSGYPFWFHCQVHSYQLPP